MNQLHSTL